MRYSLVTVLPLALALSACGNDSDQQTTAPATPVESTAPADTAPMATAPPTAESTAPVVASESMAAPIAGEVVYDPIDVSKLQSTWWQQYGKSGG